MNKKGKHSLITTRYTPILTNDDYIRKYAGVCFESGISGTIVKRPIKVDRRGSLWKGRLWAYFTVHMLLFQTRYTQTTSVAYTI